MEETKILLQVLQEKYGVMQQLACLPFSENRDLEMLALVCDMHSLVLALRRIIQAEMVRVRTQYIAVGRGDGKGV